MSHQQPCIGFIGLGLMGSPMTSCLLAAGYTVNVWNRSVEKLAAVVAKGAHAKASIAEVVQASDIVMTCVTDTDAVAAVVFGDGGVAEHGSADKILVDFSSIEPDATRLFAEKLRVQCGMEWVDTPVSGGVAGATAGTLVIMAGGDEKTIDGLRPVLASLSARVTRMGSVGSGQVTKVCNQMIVSCNVMVMAEVLALAKKNGVDATLIPAALKGGFADSTPLQITGSRMAEEDFDAVTWRVKTLLKDLDMGVGLSKSRCSATPMTGLAAQLMRQHGCQGNLDNDPCTVIKMYSSEKSSDT
jgi:3-hydroxyisobutyrate dehydrogenase